jgi:transposase
VQEWLKDTLGIVASYQAVYNLVHYKLKAKLKVARRKSRDQDSEQLEQFKINLAAEVSLLKEFCQTHLGEAASRIRYWCQDETRWSLTTICRRLLTVFGIKPARCNGNALDFGCMDWSNR